MLSKPKDATAIHYDVQRKTKKHHLTIFNRPSHLLYYFMKFLVIWDNARLLTFNLLQFWLFGRVFEQLQSDTADQVVHQLNCLMVIHGSYPHVQTALSRFLGCTLFLFLRQTVLRAYTVQNWWETVSKIFIFDARVTTSWKISKRIAQCIKGNPICLC